jgi:hypothetical protein
MGTVSITEIEASDVDVTVTWEAEFNVQNTAQFYVATSLQNLQNGVYVGTGDDSGNCPGTIFEATIPSAAPYLAAGTQYFVMAACDGTNSATSSFTTLPAGEHLGRLQSTPHIVLPGKNSILSAMVRDKGKAVPNVPVTFTGPAAVGTINGQPAGVPFQMNSDSTGSVKVTLTAGTQKGRYLIEVSAQPYCAETKHMRVVVK